LDEDVDLKLVSSIEENAYHYIEIFSRAVDKIMPQPSKEPTYAAFNQYAPFKDLC
jgi:DNA replication licensing factor MCM7